MLSRDKCRYVSTIYVITSQQDKLPLLLGGLSSLISFVFFFLYSVQHLGEPSQVVFKFYRSILFNMDFYLFVQVGSLQNAAHEDTRYRNTLDGLRKIVRNQGWRQLFAGVSINYIRVIRVLSYNQLYLGLIYQSLNFYLIHCSVVWQCKKVYISRRISFH